MCCRFCLKIKLKTVLLDQFHLLTFKELTGEDLDENEQLPLTICIMCSRELRKFQELRVNLLASQQKLKELLKNEENVIEIDSMAELVPVEEVKEEDEASVSSGSTLSQNEIEILDESLPDEPETQAEEEKFTSSRNRYSVTFKNEHDLKVTPHRTKKIVVFPSDERSSRLISTILRRKERQMTRNLANGNLN